MPEELRNKSIHDLRTIAQSFGVTDIFEKDIIHLAQEIEIKQQKLIPAHTVLPPKPEYDARLMTKPPARKSSIALITELVEPYIKLGLKLRFEEENWFMAYGDKNDSGSIRIPPRHVLNCAERLLR